MADSKAPALPPAQYANFLRVSHTPREFFLDFGQLTDGSGRAAAVGRVVTTPAHAKSMLAALADNVRRFEERFGEIEELAPANAQLQ